VAERGWKGRLFFLDHWGGHRFYHWKALPRCRLRLWSYCRDGVALGRYGNRSGSERTSTRRWIAFSMQHVRFFQPLSMVWIYSDIKQCTPNWVAAYADAVC